MKKIGVIFGMETTFPPALVEKINSMRAPGTEAELANPAIHRVMDSFDITGAHSAVLLVTTKRFRDANPALCAAILAALTQADQLIRNNPGGAAETYEALAKDQDIALEDLKGIRTRVRARKPQRATLPSPPPTKIQSAFHISPTPPQ